MCPDDVITETVSCIDTALLALAKTFQFFSVITQHFTFIRHNNTLFRARRELACAMALGGDVVVYDTIRYTRCYFKVRSKADVSQLNLPVRF